MRTEEETGLRRSLRQRHMTMISLGGVIGAGLFVGSGAVMNQTVHTINLMITEASDPYLNSAKRPRTSGNASGSQRHLPTAA